MHIYTFTLQHARNLSSSHLHSLLTSWDKTPMKKRQHPKPQNKNKIQPQNPIHKSQWHFILWRFVLGIQTIYHPLKFIVILLNQNFCCYSSIWPSEHAVLSAHINWHSLTKQAKQMKSTEVIIQHHLPYYHLASCVSFVLIDTFLVYT